MAIHGLNVTATRDFVSSRDPGKAKKGNKHKADVTVFNLGTLDSYIMGRNSDNLTSYEPTADGESATARVNIHEMAIETVRFGLKGWKNFKDSDGEDIPFVTKKTFVHGKMYEVIDDDLLGMIPMPVILELYSEINKANQMSEEDLKNFGVA